MKKNIRIFLSLFLTFLIILSICITAKNIIDVASCTGVDEKCKNCHNPYILNSHGIQYTVFINGQSLTIHLGKKLQSTYSIPSPEDEILSSFISDINNDNDDEILLLTRHKSNEYGSSLIILSYNDGFAEVFTKQMQSYNPWKVQACDIDGDNIKEISLGVYTVSAYRKDMAKRPFIYNLYKGSLYPKWLGSRLSRPFDDYIFNDIDGDNMDELLSIEVLKEGSKEIMSYKWTGFGFEGIGNSKAFDDIKCIKPDGNGINAQVFENNKWITKNYKFMEGKLIETR